MIAKEPDHHFFCHGVVEIIQENFILLLLQALLKLLAWPIQISRLTGNLHDIGLSNLCLTSSIRSASACTEPPEGWLKFAIT
jgi:hypothetical protein